MTDIDLSTWLPMAEAMAAIGVSKRTVERLARDQKLEKRLRPQDGSPPVLVFSPESVAEVAAARRREAAPFVLPTVPGGNGNHSDANAANRMQTRASGAIGVSAEDLIRQFFALAVTALQSPPSPPVAERVTETPLLTVDETATFLRVRVSRVRALIRRGTLTPVKLSSRAADWRIRRKDLEQL